MSSQKQPSVRRRLACDRCHAFKLKCPRSSMQVGDTCARCQKAGVGCSYSPSMRGQIRPKRVPPYGITNTGVTRSTRSTIVEDLINKPEGSFIDMPTFETHDDDIFNSMVLDWAVHDEDGFLHDMSQLQPPVETSFSNTATSPSQNHADFSGGSVNTSSKNHDDDFMQIVQNGPPSLRPKPSPYYLGYPVANGLQSPDVFLQLTNILVTLENLARRLPSFSVHRVAETQPTSNESQSSDNADQVADDDGDYGVGQTFAITNELADIYVPLIEQTQQRKKMSRDSLDPGGRPMDPVDHSLLNLLFACHHRLIDLWYSMLAHATAVHGSPRYAPDAEGRVQARCAQFKLGAYVPSASSTVVPVEIIILQELWKHLANRVQHLEGVINSGNTNNSNSAEEGGGGGEEEEPSAPSTRATVLSAQALHQRSLDMCAEIAQLKRLLEESTVKPCAVE